MFYANAIFDNIFTKSVLLTSQVLSLSICVYIVDDKIVLIMINVSVVGDKAYVWNADGKYLFILVLSLTHANPPDS